MSAVKAAPRKRRSPDEISNHIPKKQPAMPIVQLKPPPQQVCVRICGSVHEVSSQFSSEFSWFIRMSFLQTLNEKRTRLEKYLGHLMEKQRAMNEGPALDLSYLLTGRGARRRTTATNVPHLN